MHWGGKRRSRDDIAIKRLTHSSENIMYEIVCLSVCVCVSSVYFVYIIPSHRQNFIVFGGVLRNYERFSLKSITSIHLADA